MSCTEPLHVVFWVFFLISKQVPIYFSGGGESCDAPEMFCGSSRELPSAQGQVDDEYSIFG